MNKKLIWIFIVVIITVVIIYWFTKDTAVNNKNNIVIGATESLTGSAAYYGESAKKGIDLAFDDLKNEYPDSKFQIFHEDNQFNPKIAVDTYNKLHTIDNVYAIITHNSPSAIAIQPLAKRDGILQMAVSASAAGYSSPEDLSFRTTGGADLEVKPMIDYINNNFKKVAILYMNNEIGVSEATFLQKGLMDAKKTAVVSFEGFPVESNDYRSLLSKIKILHPDAIYVAGLASHINNALKQMKELGVNAKVLTFRTGEDPLLIQNSGELAEGVIFTSNFDQESSDPEALRFIQSYEKKYGQKPDSYAAEGYLGMKFVGDALAKCNKDYDCAKNYLFNIKDYPTLLGKISFDHNGDIAYDFFLKTVKDGKFVRLEK